jgi:hypothetical protein
MDSRLPLSPWASDGFFLLVRRLPGWPQAMWGHRRSYCVTSAFGDSHRTPRGARTSDNMTGRMLSQTRMSCFGAGTLTIAPSAWQRSGRALGSAV